MESSAEQILKTLHAAATDIQACESVAGACEETVAVAEGVLNLEMCSVLLHDDGWLEPVATSSDALPGGVRRMAVDEGKAGETYRTGASFVFEDLSRDGAGDPANPSYRAGMSVPIGTIGVFQAVSTEPGVFSDADREFVELLVAHTAQTIERLHYEENLQAEREALRRQNERLEDFVNVVSHDLRNPLNVAVGRLAQARRENDDPHLEGVARAHRRMAELIDDLLTLAREGRPVEATEPVSLAALARASWQTVATSDATLVVDTERTVLADPSRLQQLLENLLRNAVEHGGAGVTVTVSDIEGGFVVADDGPGIPEADRAVVFDRGFSTRDGGTGFGLPIVREIADVHGWAVVATARAGGGARFEFTGVGVA